MEENFEKTPLSHKLCALRCIEFETLSWGLELNSIITSFSKTLLLNSEGAVFYNVSYYYQWLSIARFPSKCLCLQLLWVLPVVSSAFKKPMGWEKLSQQRALYYHIKFLHNRSLRVVAPLAALALSKLL